MANSTCNLPSETTYNTLKIYDTCYTVFARGDVQLLHAHQAVCTQIVVMLGDTSPEGIRKPRPGERTPNRFKSLPRPQEPNIGEIAASLPALPSARPAPKRFNDCICAAFFRFRHSGTAGRSYSSGISGGHGESLRWLLETSVSGKPLDIRSTPAGGFVFDSVSFSAI